MNCHAYIWTESPFLAPVRESFRTGQPLVWTRVHDLPDFVYFNHSIHLHKGIGLCHLSWTARSHASDVENPVLTDAVVSRVPSRTGTVRPTA